MDPRDARLPETGFNLGRGVTDVAQPPLPAEKVAAAQGNLTAFRVMAFVTGVLLVTSTVALILKYATSLHMEPGTGYLWVAHGWLYFVYVIVSAVLGFKLRWPLPRYVLVLLAGTIPTMSFVAERYVTRATRAAAGAPVVAAGRRDAG